MRRTARIMAERSELEKVLKRLERSDMNQRHAVRPTTRRAACVKAERFTPGKGSKSGLERSDINKSQATGEIRCT